MIASPLNLADPNYERSLKGIESAKTVEELQVAVERMLEPYGLAHAVYHALHIPQISMSHTAIVFTYPVGWIDHYKEKKYYVIDPVVIEGLTGILPYDWSGLDKKGRAVRKLFNEAFDAGIGQHGISIPIRGSGGEHAIFTITSNASDHDWGMLRNIYMRDMQMLGFYIHSRILEILSVTTPDYATRISRRERECLQWAASGKTIEDTGVILTLSAGSVRAYLDSARHKLDCLTKTQAVARALRLGLITY